MKKLITFLFLLFAGMFGLLKASTDTIVVKAHQNVVIENEDPAIGESHYPVWAKFPSVDTRYYKVMAYLTFECPDNGFCSGWDYINYIKLGHVGGKGGDSLGMELARFITPYDPTWRKAIRPNWKHGWYFDMTDFSPYLHDSVEIVYVHTYGESGSHLGWKINLTFFITPGIPPLDVVNISPLWKGSYKYNDSIADSLKMKPISFTLTDTTKTANIKIIQSGHGLDEPDGCAEFCKKQRQVLVDGNIVNDRYMWRECGFNAVYHQMGTWIYNRGNWCPGTEVLPDDIYLLNLQGGSTHEVKLEMEPYQSTKNTGNWTYASYLIEYGAPNYKTDVAVEEIIAPSKEYGHLRLNPICGSPVVVIKNNGSDTLTSLNVIYGVKGASLKTYNWTGHLKFMEKDTLRLSSDIDWQSGDGSNTFEVNLQNPNGKTDEFPSNNTAYSAYEVADTMPNEFTIKLVTNNNPSENYYFLRNVSAQDDEYYIYRQNMAKYQIYNDSVKLKKGCYTLELYDDGKPGNDGVNRDGLYFWAHETSEGRGSFSLLNKDRQTIKTFEPDFGTKILYQFVVLTDYTAGNEQPKRSELLFDISPNPAKDKVNIKYNLQTKNNSVTIKDMLGREVKTVKLSGASGDTHVDLSALAKGTYFFILNSENGIVVTKKQVIY